MRLITDSALTAMISDDMLSGVRITSSCTVNGLYDVTVVGKKMTVPLGAHNLKREKVMAVITAEDYNEPRVLDLNGEDGNAYVLLGIAYGLLKKQGMDPDMYITMMKADDYGHLVRTFEQLFSNYFTIVLPEGIESLEKL